VADSCSSPLVGAVAPPESLGIRFRRRSATPSALASLVFVAAVAAACGSGGSGATTATLSTRPVLPTQTLPGPAGLAGGSQPQPDGYMWLLARVPGAADLHLLNLTTAKVTQVVPATASSVVVAQSPSGLVGVGLATGTTGALELRNGSSGVLVSTVPLGAPVKDVFAGADGTTFYVLDGTPTSASVTLVNSQTGKASVSVPVPLDTVAVAVDPAGQTLFTAGSSGTIDQIAIGSGTVTGSYKIGVTPIQLAISPSGTTLYVLRSTATADNVAVVDVATEAQVRALPAPAHSVGVEASLDGHSLYLIVGTGTYGNIQVFALPG